MKVMFGYNADCDRIDSVYWETEDGVEARALLSDGTFRDEKLKYGKLSDAYRRMRGSFNPFYVTEVDDVRSAFKYLGKASDLVETLPRVLFDDEQTAR